MYLSKCNGVLHTSGNHGNTVAIVTWFMVNICHHWKYPHETTTVTQFNVGTNEPASFLFLKVNAPHDKFYSVSV